MEFKKTKIEKKREYSILKKALGADFDMVKKAFPDQLKKFEDHLITQSWVASYLPSIVAKAKEQLEKDQQKESV